MVRDDAVCALTATAAPVVTHVAHNFLHEDGCKSQAGVPSGDRALWWPTCVLCPCALWPSGQLQTESIPPALANRRFSSSCGAGPAAIASSRQSDCAEAVVAASVR